MKSATVAVQNLLDSEMFVMADLLTVELQSGTTLRMTSHDIDIEWDSQTYSASDILFERSGISWKRGAEVDTMQLILRGDDDDEIDGVAFMAAIVRGALDGAEVTLQRAFWPAPGDPVTGTVILFTGRVGEISGGGLSVDVTVNSFMELLNLKMPRNVYQPGCTNTLFDAGCGLTKSAWAETATVGSGATSRSIPITGLTEADGYYDLGSIVFDSGPAQGQQRLIKRWEDDIVTLVMPLWELPESGDDVTLYPGCDKKRDTCDGTFSNEDNFLGFPYIPEPEKAV